MNLQEFEELEKRFLDQQGQNLPVTPWYEQEASPEFASAKSISPERLRSEQRRAQIEELKQEAEPLGVDVYQKAESGQFLIGEGWRSGRTQASISSAISKAQAAGDFDSVKALTALSEKARQTAYEKPEEIDSFLERGIQQMGESAPLMAKIWATQVVQEVGLMGAEKVAESQARKYASRAGATALFETIKAAGSRAAGRQALILAAGQAGPQIATPIDEIVGTAGNIAFLAWDIIKTLRQAKRLAAIPKAVAPIAVTKDDFKGQFIQKEVAAGRDPSQIPDSISEAVGIANAAIEQFAVVNPLNLVVSQAEKRILGEAVKFGANSMMKSLATYATRLGLKGGIELSEEFWQPLVEQYGSEIIDTAIEKQILANTIEAVKLTGVPSTEMVVAAFDQMMEAIPGVTLMTLLGGAPAGVSVYNQTRSANTQIQALEKELNLEKADAQQVYQGVVEKVSKGEYIANQRKIESPVEAYINELNNRVSSKREGIRKETLRKEQEDAARESEAENVYKQNVGAAIDNKDMSAEEMEAILNQETESYVKTIDGDQATVEVEEGQQPWQTQTIYDEDDLRSELRARAARDARAELKARVDQELATIPGPNRTKQKAAADIKEIIAQELVQKYERFGVTKSDVLAREGAQTIEQAKEAAKEEYFQESLRSTEKKARKSAKNRIKQINKELRAIRNQGIDVKDVAFDENSMARVEREDGSQVWSANLFKEESILQLARTQLVSKKLKEEEESRKAQIQAQAKLAEKEEAKSGVLNKMRDTTPWVTRSWLSNVFVSGKDKADLRLLRDEVNEVLDGEYGNSEMELRRFAKETWGWEPEVQTSEARAHADRRLERPMLIERYKELAGDNADIALIESGLNSEIKSAIRAIEKENKSKKKKSAAQKPEKTQTTFTPDQAQEQIDKLDAEEESIGQKMSAGTATDADRARLDEISQERLNIQRQQRQARQEPVEKEARKGTEEKPFKTEEEAKKAAQISAPKLTKKQKVTAEKAKASEEEVLERATQGLPEQQVKEVGEQARRLAQRARTGSEARKRTPFAIFLVLIKNPNKSFTVEDIRSELRSLGVETEAKTIKKILDADSSLEDAFVFKNTDESYSVKVGPIVRVEAGKDPKTGKVITKPFDPTQKIEEVKKEERSTAEAANAISSVPWASKLLNAVLERLGIIGQSRDGSTAHARHISRKINAEIQERTGLSLSKSAMEQLERGLKTIGLKRSAKSSKQFESLIKGILKAHAKSALLNAEAHREIITLLNKEKGMVPTERQSDAIDLVDKIQRAKQLWSSLFLSEPSVEDIDNGIAGIASIFATDDNGNVNEALLVETYSKMSSYLSEYKSTVDSILTLVQELDMPSEIAEGKRKTAAKREMSSEEIEASLENAAKILSDSVRGEILLFAEKIEWQNYIKGIFTVYKTKEKESPTEVQSRIKNTLDRYYSVRKDLSDTASVPVPDSKGVFKVDENFDVEKTLKEIISLYRDDAAIISSANLEANSRGKDSGLAYDLRRSSVMASILREVMRQLDPESEIGSLFAKYTSTESAEGQANRAKAEEYLNAAVAASPKMDEQKKESIFNNQLEQLAIDQILEERSDWINKTRNNAYSELRTQKNKDMLDMLSGASGAMEVSFTSTMVKLANRLVGAVFSPVVGGRPVKGFFSKAALSRRGKSAEAIWIPKLDEWTIEVSPDEINHILYSSDVRDAIRSIYGQIARLVRAAQQGNLSAVSPENVIEGRPIIPLGLRAAISNDQRRYKELVNEIATQLLPRAKEAKELHRKASALTKGRKGKRATSAERSAYQKANEAADQVYRAITTIEQITGSKLVGRVSDKNLVEMILDGEAYRQINEKVRTVSVGKGKTEYRIIGLRQIIGAKTIAAIKNLTDAEVNALKIKDIDSDLMIGLKKRMDRERKTILELRDAIQNRMSEIASELSESNVLGYKSIIDELGINKIEDERVRNYIRTNIQRALYKAFKSEAPRITVSTSERLNPRLAGQEGSEIIELIEDKNAVSPSEAAEINEIDDQVEVALEALSEIDNGPAAKRIGSEWELRREELVALVREYQMTGNPNAYTRAMAAIQAMLDYDNAAENGELTQILGHSKTVGETLNDVSEYYGKVISQAKAEERDSRGFTQRPKPVFIQGKEPPPRDLGDTTIRIGRTSLEDTFQVASVSKNTQEVKDAMLREAQNDLRKALVSKNRKAINAARKKLWRIRSLTLEQIREKNKVVSIKERERTLSGARDVGGGQSYIPDRSTVSMQRPEDAVPQDVIRNRLERLRAKEESGASLNLSTIEGPTGGSLVEGSDFAAEAEAYRQERLGTLRERLSRALRSGDETLAEDLRARINGLLSASQSVLAAEMAQANPKIPGGRLYQTAPSITQNEPATVELIDSFFSDLFKKLGGNWNRDRTPSDTVGLGKLHGKTLRVIRGNAGFTPAGERAAGYIEEGAAGEYTMVVDAETGTISTLNHELGHMLFDMLTDGQKSALKIALGYDISTVSGQERFVSENLESQEARDALADRILGLSVDQRSVVVRAINFVIRGMNAFLGTNISEIGRGRQISGVTAVELSEGLRDFSLILQDQSTTPTESSTFVERENARGKEKELSWAQTLKEDGVEAQPDKRYQSAKNQAGSWREFKAANFVKGKWSTEIGKAFLASYKARGNKKITLPEFFRGWQGSGKAGLQQEAIEYARDVERAHPKTDTIRDKRNVWSRIRKQFVQQTMMNLPNILRHVSPKMADELLPEYRKSRSKYRGLQVRANQMLLDRMNQEGDVMQRMRRSEDITTDINGTTDSFTVSKTTWYNIVRLAMNDEALSAMSNYFTLENSDKVVLVKNKKSFIKNMRSLAETAINTDPDIRAMFEVENQITDMLFDEVNTAYKAITPKSEWHTSTGLKKAKFYAAIHRDVEVNVSAKRLGDITRLIRAIKSATEQREKSNLGVRVGDGLIGLSRTIESSAKFAGLAEWTTKVRDLMSEGWRTGEALPNSLARTIIAKTDKGTWDNLMEGLDQIEGKQYESNDAVARASQWFFRNWASVRLTGPTTILMQVGGMFIPSVLYDSGVTLRAAFNGTDVENEKIAQKYQAGMGGSIVARLQVLMPFDEINELGQDVSGSRLAAVGRKTREIIFAPTRRLDQSSVRYAGRVARQWVEENMASASAEQKEVEFLRRWDEMLEFQMVGDPAMKTIYHNKGVMGKALNLFRTTVNAQGMKFAEIYMKTKASTDPQVHADFLRRGISSAVLMMAYFTAVRSARVAAGVYIAAALFGDDDDKKEALKKIPDTNEKKLLEATRMFLVELGSAIPGISIIGQGTSLLAEYLTLNRQRQVQWAAQGGASRSLPIDAAVTSTFNLVRSYSDYQRFLESMAEKYSADDISRIGVSAIDAPYLMLQDVPEYWNKQDRIRMRNLQRRIYKSHLAMVNTIPVVPLPVEIYSNLLGIDKALFSIGD